MFGNPVAVVPQTFGNLRQLDGFAQRLLREAPPPREDTPTSAGLLAYLRSLTSEMNVLKFVVALPHIIVMALLAVAAIVAMWFGYIVAAFTGRLSTGIQDFVAGVLQWNLRVYAWLAGLTDEYPPFNLEATPSDG